MSKTLVTAIELRMDSKAMFFYGLLHIDTLVLAKQQKLTFIGSVHIIQISCTQL